LPDARVRTPKPVADNRDVRGAPLSPTDGFVLSRVDGIVTEKDILAATGLPDDQVYGSLAKLEALGLITFDGPRSPTPASSGAVAAAEAHVTSSTQLRAAPARPEPPLTPEEEVALGEEVELDVEIRRRVLVMYRGLQSLDHYALLGVASTADRKELKRAYFDLAAKFHPDKYFRKKLGTFKLRMEAIFGRITQAHDTLTSREARAEYDAYLDEQRRSRGIEELLADALAEVSRAKENIEREAVAHEAPPAVSSSAPSLRDASSASGVSAVDPAVRREALARRLLAGRGGATGSSSTPPNARTSSSASMPAITTTDAMDVLRRRYEERKSMAQAAQARKYMASAESAMATGDAVAASNAFRVALTLAPDEPGLVKRATEAQTRADSILAETYTRQASYEEKNDQWPDAARSWARVCRARPDDPMPHERAANAVVKAGGDLHEASRLAQRACTLDAESASFRTTLASVYLAAGLTRNARRELETAAQLAPHDGTIQAMLKRVGKSA
jgi:curved DNA-binding protein CbpA